MMDKIKNSIRKVLFLDIDGVLNRAEYGKDLYNDTYGDYCAALHRPSVEALKKLLLKHTDLKIAWISDWAKCERNVYNKIHCCMDTLSALESFPCIKERVIGNVYVGKHECAKCNERMDAIDAFIKENLVESYVILDDFDYSMDESNMHLFKHFVHINPLKSFLDDDISLVEKMLDMPTDMKFIHDILLSLEQSDSFVVNDKYECKFDFERYSRKKASLFTPFKKDENSPRRSAEVDVSVYDIINRIHLDGKIVLSIDDDLKNQHYASLWMKQNDKVELDPILKLNNIKKTMN